MFSFYRLITFVYFLVPFIAIGITGWQSYRSKSWGRLRSWLLSCLIGMVCGIALAIVYVARFHGRVAPMQALATAWWGAAVVCLLRALNVGLIKAGEGIARLTEKKLPRWVIAGGVTRAFLLLIIGLPYVFSMLLVFRPKVVHSGTPQSVLGVDYQEVQFLATDGVPIRGWWIPTAQNDKTDHHHPAAAWGERTIILCHGYEGDKSSDLQLVRDLVPNGYNVLAIDFRAHGQSGGQFTTFGDLERRDVLGAVQWLQAEHPAQATRIFGLGEGLGSVALIAAAADASPEGQAIDAIAVFSPYGKLRSFISSIADRDSSIVNWMATKVVLPVADLQVGAPISNFSPDLLVKRIWPRPILMIASQEDGISDIEQTQALFDQALQPKFALWRKRDSHPAMLFSDRQAALTVRIFFETERSIL